MAGVAKAGKEAHNVETPLTDCEKMMDERASYYELFGQVPFYQQYRPTPYLTAAQGTTAADSRHELPELPEAKRLVGGVESDITNGAPDTYVQLCNQIKYWPARFIDSQMVNFCKTFMRKNEFLVYDAQAVADYLEKVCNRRSFELFQYASTRRLATLAARSAFRPSVSYEWRPIRELDNADGSKLFSEVIPEEALQVMAKVAMAWEVQTKDTPMSAVRATFEATEIREDPDPFMRVVFRRPGAPVNAKFVIAHWDEPGFSVLPDRK